MHQQRRQAGAVVGYLDRLDARMADDGSGVFEQLHRLGVDVHAALGARVDESLAGLVVARRPPEAGGGGVLVALALRLAPARLDLVAHAGPFVEPGLVVADAALERAANAMHLVDLDAHPRRAREADQEPHRPAIVVGEIQEGGVVFAADHGCFSDVAKTLRMSSPRKRGPSIPETGV